jgi:hypothetical protein
LKLKDIKETSSDGVKIITELGSPQTAQTFDKIKETAKTVQGIMESFKDPGMVRNIENIRIMSENMENLSERMKNAVSEFKTTGIIDETKETTRVIKKKMDSISNSNNSQNLKELTLAFKDVVQSIKDLADEMKLTAVSASSK